MDPPPRPGRKGIKVFLMSGRGDLHHVGLALLLRQPCHALLEIILQVPTLRPSLADPFRVGKCCPGHSVTAPALSKSPASCQRGGGRTNDVVHVNRRRRTRPIYESETYLHTCYDEDGRQFKRWKESCNCMSSKNSSSMVSTGKYQDQNSISNQAPMPCSCDAPIAL
ncbi:hypothetical protein AUEXF2481DRAFT_598205 [Aureobasidium subglaciale EXF-2481]|uniref:Uncharacterized protein n=1 Tax=Aureobasidium subglaciale (strain EXF-2481) TaxID=1043005 RepID=A0A074YHW5_AURSE|nr:uncharacterized protein AUEXF2481DRAFT_598205 [Aureobasidium subglaciale EXF-2481]KEQ97418.1 hypothetical protein AUEXF2481DRAFT_598205 [Aureobasidium subglaciale EXF-2481]